MAMLFLRIFFVCAVILSVCPAKTKTQVANVNSESEEKNISDIYDVTEPEDVVVLKGQPATLKCSIRPRGPPSENPTVTTWMHQMQPIPDDDNRRTVQKDGSLHIPRVTSGGRRPLTGSYRCKVKNDVGAMVSGEVKVQIASLDFNVTDVTIEVAEQQPVILPCQVNSVPEAKLRWEFKKQPLPHDSRYVPLPSGALLILKTLSTDDGVYRCMVSNSVLKKSKSKSVTLKVLPPHNKNEAVSFLPLPEPLNSTVTVGLKSSLHCIAGGWPLPKIEWLKDGIVISNTSVLNFITDAQSENITYICRAQNGQNVATQTYNLKVQRKPYFTKTPTSVSYVNAGIVKLACAAGGMPPPCIQWLKDGKKVELGARTKIRNGTLVMSHTFTNDVGIYQCIASNSAGTIWAPAQVLSDPRTPPVPPPPEDVKCRSYDRKSICLTWREPENVLVRAYSIFSFYSTQQECLGGECQGTNNFIGCEDGSHEEPGPDYVTTNGTFILADRLNSSTNYTFYMRLYSKGASDDSNWVTCNTVVKGERNLRFKLLGDNSIELVWSEISSDIACGSTNTSYIVQWKNEVDLMVNTNSTENLKYNITGLNPSVNYHIRVMSSSYQKDDTSWVLLKLPEVDDEATANQTYISFDEKTITQNVPTNPEGFRATNINSKSVTLNWMSPEKEPEFYAICYAEVGKECEKGTIVKSFQSEMDMASAIMWEVLNEDVEDAEQQYQIGVHVLSKWSPFDLSDPKFIKMFRLTKAQLRTLLSNIKQIEDLKPNTMYEFRIRSHNAEGFHGPFSSPIEVRTHPDVPSTVLDLKYRIINDTTACLAWLPPLYTHGRLLNYIVTYTSNSNRPLEEWISLAVPANRASDSACWFDKKKSTISVMLKDLELTEAYTIIVRAASDNGLSNPTFPFVLRTAYKQHDSMRTGMQEEITSKQKMGVVVGCILALICIACCISCIVLRRRCVKRRNLAHARLAASNNHYPAAAHYDTQGSTVQVRLENICDTDLREIENLVTEEERNEALPQPVYLDSKGRDEIPNGNENGLEKPLTNGHILNGHVHITENPQFERKDKNGDIPRNGYKKSPQYTLFQDDTNCNHITSPRHKHYIDPSPKRRNKCNGLFNGGNHSDDETMPFSTKDLDLETTQLTTSFFDDPFIIGQHRRISPLMGSNG